MSHALSPPCKTGVGETASLFPIPASRKAPPAPPQPCPPPRHRLGERDGWTPRWIPTITSNGTQRRPPMLSLLVTWIVAADPPKPTVAWTPKDREVVVLLGSAFIEQEARDGYLETEL